MEPECIPPETDAQYPIVRHDGQASLRMVRLNESERVALRQYEATIHAGLANFIAVGTALSAIKQERLYRETHRTFEAYCRDTFGLSRSTAYQKQDAALAYQSVSAIADISQVNEYQMRQLAMLKTPEERQRAWQEVEHQQKSTGKTLPATHIRRIVNSIQTGGMDTPFETRLTADGIFPAITWRWDLITLTRNPDMRTLVKQLIPLPAITPSEENAKMHGEYNTPQLVIVNPDSDLADTEIPDAYAQTLMQAMATVPQCRFILWTRQPEWFRRFPLPPANVDLMVQVTSQAEFTQAVDAHTQLQPEYTLASLWVLPESEINWKAQLPFTRVLVGGPEYAMPKSASEGGNIYRRLIGQLMGEAASLHLAKPVQALLAQPSTYIPRPKLIVTVNQKHE